MKIILQFQHKTPQSVRRAFQAVQGSCRRVSEYSLQGTHLSGRFRTTKSVLALCILFLGFQGISIAQPVPAAFPENWGGTFMISSVGDDVVVNCDMISEGSNGSIKAIVRGSNGTPTAVLFVEDNIGQTLQATIVGPVWFSEDPDVVIGNTLNPVTGGTDYWAAITYVQSGAVYLETWQIVDPGLPTFALVPSSGPIRISSLTGVADGHPHIDMFSDASLLLNGAPSLHKLAVVWTENGGDIYAITDEIASPGAGFLTTIALTGYLPGTCRYADVAAATDIATGHEWLYFVRQWR